MNKVVVAQVNADVRCAVSVGAEENQIAGNEVSCGNRRAKIVLNVSGARNGNARLCEDVLNVAGAVKSVRSCAAKDVGNADIIHRRRNNTACQIARAVSDVRHLFAEKCRIRRRTY